MATKNFHRFLDISQSSAVEVKSVTYVLEDMEYFNTDTILLLRQKADETKKRMLALMRYLKSFSQ